MTGFYYHAPLDPNCPDAPDIEGFLDDPMTRYSGCADEFVEDFEAKHLAKCERCQEYGAANIEVMGP